MSNINELMFSKSHEWVKFLDNGNAVIGLTDFAQQTLGDLVFVGLPDVGDKVVVGESFSDVESVKAVSDVFSPLSGEVVAVNENVLNSPESINSTPYDSWLIEVNNITNKEELLNLADYEELVKEEE